MKVGLLRGSRMCCLSCCISSSWCSLIKKLCAIFSQPFEIVTWEYQLNLISWKHSVTFDFLVIHSQLLRCKHSAATLASGCVPRGDISVLKTFGLQLVLHESKHINSSGFIETCWKFLRKMQSLFSEKYSSLSKSLCRDDLFWCTFHAVYWRKQLYKWVASILFVGQNDVVRQTYEESYSMSSHKEKLQLF